MMTETVVHVTTLEQWKSVLYVWFKQGNMWLDGGKGYSEDTFERGGRYLFLGGRITWSVSKPSSKPYIEYSEFMAQRKENNKMATYYVTKEQLDLIEELKSNGLPFYHLVNSIGEDVEDLSKNISDELERPILRYLGGDKTVEFKVKEQLYRLYLVDVLGQRNYFTISNATALPDRTVVKEKAFVETLEEIKKWQTPAWEIEKV